MGEVKNRWYLKISASIINIICLPFEVGWIFLEWVVFNLNRLNSHLKGNTTKVGTHLKYPSCIFDVFTWLLWHAFHLFDYVYHHICIVVCIPILEFCCITKKKKKDFCCTGGADGCPFKIFTYFFLFT